MASVGSRRASVTVDLPDLIKNPDKRARQIVAATRAGLKTAMVKTFKDITTEPGFPRSRGFLLKSLKVTDPMQTRDGVSSKIISRGVAAVYAPVVDQGRTPGKRLWFGHLLYGTNDRDWRNGWVWRKMKNEVKALAGQLQARYKAQHPRKRKGVSRAQNKFLGQAAFLLARKVAQGIVARGIEATQFASRYTKPGPSRKRLLQTLSRSMAAEWKRRGLTQ